MKKINSERGQSLVEISISLVIILYLLSGAVEFGIALFQFVQLRDAAQEGALYGSINPPLTTSDSDIDRVAIISRTRNASSAPLNLADTNLVKVTVTTNYGNGTCLANGTYEVTVTTSYNHVVFLPFFRNFSGISQIPLTATVVDTILVCS
jgi:Flp pilus assembly protein TadG